jgi:hypothetical protein
VLILTDSRCLAFDENQFKSVELPLCTIHFDRKEELNRGSSPIVWDARKNLRSYLQRNYRFIKGGQFIVDEYDKCLEFGFDDQMSYMN